MRIFAWLIYTLLALLFIWLAVANRAVVTISLSPLDYAIDMPLFFVVVLGVALGFLILGPIGAWKRWRLRRQVKRLESEKAKLEKNLADMTAERDRLAGVVREGDQRITAAQNTGAYGKNAPGLLPTSK